MLILGIDPGNYVMGYGFIEYDLETKVPTYRSHGFIRETLLKYPDTLCTQTNKLKPIIEGQMPDIVAIEGAKDIKGFISHQRQSEIIGCIKHFLVEKGIAFMEIPPSTMKKVVTGNGYASKEEVARVLADKFNMEFEDLVITTYYKQGLKKGQIKSYLADGSDALGLAMAFPTYYSRVKELDYNGRRLRKA